MIVNSTSFSLFKASIYEMPLPQLMTSRKINAEGHFRSFLAQKSRSVLEEINDDFGSIDSRMTD
ncbi:hypothetical protein BK140_01735 [Paenibacillus macerans]|nr:hypothetical protein BK140_01735 [Paenibacillus macerans]